MLHVRNVTDRSIGCERDVSTCLRKNLFRDQYHMIQTTSFNDMAMQRRCDGTCKACVTGHARRECEGNHEMSE